MQFSPQNYTFHRFVCIRYQVENPHLWFNIFRSDLNTFIRIAHYIFHIKLIWFLLLIVNNVLSYSPIECAMTVSIFFFSLWSNWISLGEKWICSACGGQLETEHEFHTYLKWLCHNNSRLNSKWFHFRRCPIILRMWLNHLMIVIQSLFVVEIFFGSIWMSTRVKMR